MKAITLNRRLRAGATALALLGTLFWGGTASAAGTLSGTSISNLATLSYAVGGTTQTSIGSSAAGNTAGAGTATTFLVDNKVNLSVLETGSAVTSVVPGTINQVTTFSVTNTGNTAQGYTLVGANVAGLSIAGTADGIDVTNLRVFVENGTTGGFQAAEDTATAISTLAADGTITVYIVADIPIGATNGQQANVSLTATTTTTATTTAVVQHTGADDPAVVEIVFADAATVELEFVGASAARNALGTARDAYRIASAVISVTKTSLLICDPFNGSGATRKNIPGAIVRWTITISNATGAGASATLAQVTDTLNVNTTFDANLVTGAGDPATTTSCTSASGTPESAAGSGFKIDVTGDTRTGASGTFPAFLTTAANADGATAASGVGAVVISPNDLIEK